MRAIEKYKDHPSIRVIKQHVNDITFKFSHVNSAEAMKQIDPLDSKKSNSGNIPTDILKEAKELLCKFPDEMKIAERISVYRMTTQIQRKTIDL